MPMMDIFLIAAEAGGEEAVATAAAATAAAELAAGAGLGANAGITAASAFGPQSAMALDAAAGGAGSAVGTVPAGINQATAALQQGTVAQPGLTELATKGTVPTLNLPPPQPFPYQVGLENVPGAPVAPPPVAPPPVAPPAPAGITAASPVPPPPPPTTPPFAGGQSPGFLERIFGNSPAPATAPPAGLNLGPDVLYGANPTQTAFGSNLGPDVMLSSSNTAAPTSAFQRGLDSAMDWAKAHPFQAATAAYTGASLLGLTRPNYGNFNSAPYSGPLSKYKLSPNYQATVANPSQYQYAPRYAEGGIMQMAEGGVTGSGNLTLNVPIDFGGSQNSTQSTPNYAFGNNNSGANTGFFGQNNTQVSAPVNPQGPTNSFMTQQAGTPDLMQSFQQLKPEMQSAPINVGGPADISQDQNQSQKFAAGGSTGNLSSTLDYYTKMMEGETPKMPSSHPTDAGIYHDNDPDTRNLDAYSAARVRQAKTNKRAYVSAPQSPAPFPIGQLNLSPPGAKSDATQYQEAAKGGIMGLSDLGGYAAGGNPRLLKGPGDGMSDNIPAVVNGRQPARLADGEFVIPADVVSHLGNGSTDAGAKVLHQMMTKVRQERTGNPKQGKQINPNKYMPR